MYYMITAEKKSPQNASCENDRTRLFCRNSELTPQAGSVPPLIINPQHFLFESKTNQSLNRTCPTKLWSSHFIAVTCDECKRADRDVMPKKEEALWVSSSLAYIRMRCHRQLGFGGRWQQKIYRYWFSIHLLGFKCAELWQSSPSKK